MDGGVSPPLALRRGPRGPVSAIPPPIAPGGFGPGGTGPKGHRTRRGDWAQNLGPGVLNLTRGAPLPFPLWGPDRLFPHYGRGLGKPRAPRAMGGGGINPGVLGPPGAGAPRPRAPGGTPPPRGPDFPRAGKPQPRGKKKRPQDGNKPSQT